MRLSIPLKVLATLLPITMATVHCASASEKKATPKSPPLAPTTTYDTAAEANSANSGGTATDPVVAVAPPSMDKSCTSKESCTPARVDLVIDPSAKQLNGVVGQMVNWQLTAVDTLTIGGTVTPLPIANSSGTVASSAASSLALIDGALPSVAVPTALPGFTPVAANNSLAGKSARHVVMILSNVPPEATVTPITMGKPVVTATITWIPTAQGARSLNVVLRDFDRCIVSEPDQTACERSTILPAYDTQYAPLPIVITNPKAKK